MAWAKAPFAIGAAACAACLAFATTLPVTAPVAEKFVKGPVTTNVNLAAINFANLDLLSAIPAIQALINDGDTSGLATLDGIPAFLAFLNDRRPGVPSSQSDDSNGGYAALSGLNSLLRRRQHFRHRRLQCARCDESLGDLDSLNGIPAFQEFFATRRPARVRSERRSARLCRALRDWGRTRTSLGGDFSTIGNLDSLSAIPSYQTLLSGNATPGEIG